MITMSTQYNYRIYLLHNYAVFVDNFEIFQFGKCVIAENDFVCVVFPLNDTYIVSFTAFISKKLGLCRFFARFGIADISSLLGIGSSMRFTVNPASVSELKISEKLR